MTSTPVKQTGNILLGLTPGTAGRAGAANKASFHDVWNSQTGKNGQTSDSVPQNCKSVRQDNSPKEQDAGRVSETKDVNESRGINKNAEAKGGKAEENLAADNDGTEIKDLEKAMEVLGTAAAGLMDKIADIFGISMEEIQGVLNQMSMEPVDLLDPEALSAFLLKAGGAEDSFALLTDEALYQNFKDVMGELDSMVQDSRKAGMDLHEMQNMLSAREELAAQAKLPIEVTVEEAVQSPSEDGLVSEEGRDAVLQIPAEQADAGKTAASDDRQTKQDSDKGRSENQDQKGGIFQQNLKAEQFGQQPVQTQEVAGGWSTDTQNIMRQIMDYMKIQVKPDMSNLEMQLHPESLGSLHIHVASKGGVVTANFITQNEAVKAALESQMVQLKESFAQQGVKVEAIEVTVQTHQFEQNLEQGQNRQQNEPGKGQKNRRIRLDGPLSAEEPENLAGEEQLTAQMMAANGNTVDYTV